MWDDVPYLNALLRAAHPGVRQEEGLAEFIRRAVLSTAEQEPRFLDDVEEGLVRQPCGFVYDRSSGLVFLGQWASAQRAAAALMQLHVLRAPANWNHAENLLSTRAEPLAEQYVEDGFGFIAQPPVASEQRWVLRVGQDVLLSAQEQLRFGELAVCHC